VRGSDKDQVLVRADPIGTSTPLQEAVFCLTDLVYCKVFLLISTF
jgi:hypothetical protein